MTSPQAILALDCSFAGLSLALRAANGQIWRFATPETRSSDLLPVELEKILKQSDISAENIAAVALTVGPGSFTGCRLGLAAAEALRLLNPALQIVGLSTLQALALQTARTHQPEGDITLILDAAGGQAYAQTFTAAGEAKTAAACLPLPQIALNGFVAAQSSLMLPPPAVALQGLDAAILLEMLENPASHLPPEPLYLKPLTYKHA